MQRQRLPDVLHDLRGNGQRPEIVGTQEQSRMHNTTSYAALHYLPDVGPENMRRRAGEECSARTT